MIKFVVFDLHWISLEICKGDVFGVPRCSLSGMDVSPFEYSLWVAIFVEITKLFRHVISLLIAYWKPLYVGHATTRLRKVISIIIIYNTHHDWLAFFTHVMLWRWHIHGIFILCINSDILILFLNLFLIVLVVLRSSLDLSDLALTNDIGFAASCCHLARKAADSLNVSPSTHMLHAGLVGLVSVTTETLHVSHTAYPVMLVVIIVITKLLHVTLKSNRVYWMGNMRLYVTHSIFVAFSHFLLSLLFLTRESERGASWGVIGVLKVFISRTLTPVVNFSRISTSANCLLFHGGILGYCLSNGISKVGVHVRIRWMVNLSIRCTIHGTLQNPALLLLFCLSLRWQHVLLRVLVLILWTTMTHLALLSYKYLSCWCCFGRIIFVRLA